MSRHCRATSIPFDCASVDRQRASADPLGLRRLSVAWTALPCRDCRAPPSPREPPCPPASGLRREQVVGQTRPSVPPLLVPIPPRPIRLRPLPKSHGRLPHLLDHVL